MRRRVGLAQALLGDPDLVILDEPTAGLDPEQRLQFREIVSQIGEQRTVILSTHLAEDVAAVCHQVVVLNEGRCLFTGSPGALIDRAAGRVWTDRTRGAGARVAWRGGDGLVRNVGDPPPEAQRVPATLEDGYLLLVGDREPAVAA
jgi:ABC-2 type transport system ATP-binding protein